jgi:hypothetical protein
MPCGGSQRTLHSHQHPCGVLPHQGAERPCCSRRNAPSAGVYPNRVDEALRAGITTWPPPLSAAAYRRRQRRL